MTPARPRDHAVEKLPAPLRAWAPTRRLSFRGRGRIGAALVRRFAERDVPYRNPDGLALAVDPDDFFEAMMLLGAYDPPLCDLIRRHVRRDTVALDVGHHIGYATLQMAALGAEVHAFDPDPRAHDRLRRHLELNDAERVTLDRRAVTDRLEEVELGINERLGWSSTKAVKPVEAWISVQSVTIDAYLEERGIAAAGLSFAKIDVEGGELEALTGMRATLEAGSPVVVVELIPGRPHERATEVVAYMDSLGYAASGAAGDVVFTKS